MKIEVAGFSGMRPAVGDAFLEANQAVLARDCRLYSGELVPMRESVTREALAKTGVIRTLFNYVSQYWFHWTQDVEVVRNPTPGGANEMVFWTGEGIPRATSLQLAVSGGTQYPVGWRHLGVPRPDNAPTLQVLEAGSEMDQETRFYVYTFVNEWGWESAPSPPSAALSIGVDGEVRLDNMSPAPAGPYDWAYRRIYRLSTGVDASAFLFVAELPVAQTQYDDSLYGDQLREVMETEGWFPPPDNMRGLCALASGALCGFEGHTLYFSPVGVSYAYPRAWSLGTEYDIVALAAFENNVVVGTEGHPYLATGVDPSAMTLTKLEIDQACVSARSMVSAGALGVVYASPDGLVAIGNEIDILSNEYMTREEWQEYNPESILGVAHDRQYIGFYEKTGGEKGALVFSPVNGFLELDLTATAAYADLLTDTVYFVDGDEGQVREMDAGDPTPYRWRSKEFKTPPTSFTAFRVMGEPAETAWDLQLTLWADGEQVFQASVADNHPRRLPAVPRARRWQFEVTGTQPIEGVQLATTVSELRE